MTAFLKQRASFLALLVLLAVPAALLSADAALELLPLASWPSAVLQADLRDPAQLLARHSFLPQIAVAMLAGAALALSGVLLQQALKNPLAEPTTLGTSAGAGLALTLAAIFAPWMLENGRELIALGGAAAATAIVFLIASGGRLSVSALVLAGMIVAMTASAATAVFLSLFTDYLGELFIWQSGSLVQNGDRLAFQLASRLLPAAAVTLLMARPLSALAMDDTTMSSVGLKPWQVRLIAVGLAVALAASVAAAVGVIAFIGLAAPVLARATGARTFGQVAARATVIGGLLLLLVDRLAEILFSNEMPAGSLTALVGAPLLFMLIGRIPADIGSYDVAAGRRSVAGLRAILYAGLSIAVLVIVALTVGPTVDGHSIAFSPLTETFEFRWPRVLGAASAGSLLAIAGCTMQRISANPLAAPEGLGISGGATIGVLALLTMTSGTDPAKLAVGAAIGALIACLLVTVFAWRGGFRPERMLLCGLAVTMLATAWASVFLATGDPRTTWVMTWLSGSTYRIGADQAVLAAGVCLAALLAIPLLERWLTVLPLGRSVASALGISVAAAWGVSFLVSAVATGLATLLVGPLSFVGLTAPHLARLIGLQDARPQMLGSAVIGAGLMIAADWLGRIIVFPWETPAGIIAAFLGGPYMLWALRRRR